MPHDDEVLIPQEETLPGSWGVFCFLDKERICSPECAAYTTHPRQARSSDLSEQQAHCALLAGLERTGRGTISLASIISQIAKKRSLTEADRRRSEQFDRPREQANHSPFGKGQ